MPTQDEKNLALNRFMGWQPGMMGGPPFTPPWDFYADTPEARERTKLLKDEFVRQNGHDHRIWVETFLADDAKTVYVNVGIESEDAPIVRLEEYAIESHAILNAIYEAIK